MRTAAVEVVVVVLRDCRHIPYFQTQDIADYLVDCYEGQMFEEDYKLELNMAVGQCAACEQDSVLGQDSNLD